MKYEILLNDAKNMYGVTVYRIRALRDIERFGVKAGDLGGYVESHSNLSHKGSAWLGSGVCVTGKTHVSGSVLLNDNHQLVIYQCMLGLAALGCVTM